MSKDKIEVSMSVYDIPIVIEALEKAEDEIKKLQQENQQLKKQKDEIQKEMDYVDDYNRHLLKQKDDVVEYIKKQSKFIQGCDIYQPLNKDIILRMLGEIDE